MLDRRLILDHLDEIRENNRRRGVAIDLDQLLTLETARRTALARVETLNAEANAVAKSVGKTKDPAERDALIASGRDKRAEKDAVQAEHDRLDQDVLEIVRRVPNLTHPGAPVGGEDDSVEIRLGVTPIPTFNFPVKDHVELGESLDLIDFEGGARTTGNGFYFLRNEAVLLDLALQRFAVGELMAQGFTPTVTPDLALDSILEGIGFNPRGESTQVYSIDGMDLSLVGTAEITLGGLYAGRVFEAAELPLRLCGISHCYRTEAGAAGRASRGLYRVHQFTKIEMFAYTHPEQSEAMLAELLKIECDLFDKLAIAYRVIDTASGDLGGPAYRKYDLEAWMPGRGESGEYGEVTSTSNCTDYQSRRLGIRYKTPGEKGTQLVHTLNGTAIACSRALVAIIENYQNADGSLTVPEVLRPFMGMDRITRT